METLKKLIAFVRQLPLAGKVISVIIVVLVYSLLTFFVSGCTLTLHPDILDNSFVKFLSEQGGLNV